VVVDEPGGLHEGVAYCRSDEFEPAFLEVFAHGFGLFCFRRHIGEALEAVLDCFSAHEAPDVRVEVAEFFLDFEEPCGVVYGRGDFALVMDYPRHFHQSFNIV
jgi:hypothetical protein